MSGTLGTVLLGLLAVVSTLSAGLETGSLREAMPRRTWLLALVANLALIPLLAFALLALFGLAPEVATGMLLAAAIPGGPTGPLIAALARPASAPEAAAEASGALFVVLALIAGAVVPLIAGAAGLGLDTLTVAALLAVQLGPWMVGAWLRRSRPALARRLTRPLQRAGTLLLLVIIVGLVIAEGAAIGVVGWDAFAAAALIVLGTGAVSFTLLGDAASRPLRASLTGVSLVRNLTLALLVAAAAAAPAVTSLAILVFGIAMFALAFAVAGALRWRTARARPGRS